MDGELVGPLVFSNYLNDQDNLNFLGNVLNVLLEKCVSIFDFYKMEHFHITQMSYVGG